MQGKRFHIKTFATISVFSFFISYCTYVSTSYLIENVENFPSIRSNQNRRRAADTGYNVEPNDEPLFNKHASDDNSEEYTDTFQKTSSALKIRTKRSNLPLDEDADFSELVNTKIERYTYDNITEKERILRRNFLMKLYITKKQCREIEIRTKKHRFSKEWFQQRKYRLPSSKFGKCARLYSEDARRKYVYYLLNGYNNTADRTKYKYNSIHLAKEQLQRILERPIRRSGLMIDLGLPFLTASPDGLIGKNGIVEFKLPPSAEHYTPEEAILKKKVKFCGLSGGEFYLKRSSNFYYEVQGQLHIANKLYCYFCLWTPKGMVYERVQRNDTFWNRKMRKQLNKFYINEYLPALVLRQQKNILHKQMFSRS